MTTLGGPEKANMYLARFVADRMGLRPGKVRVLDGESLNCTRANLALRCAPSRHWRSDKGTTRPVQPRGLHRHAVGDIKPPAEYAICEGPKEGWICLERQIVGFARRHPDGWQVRRSIYEMRYGEVHRSFTEALADLSRWLAA